MSTSSSTGIGASPGERIELLDEIEKDVIGILVNSGGALQEISKDRPSQKQVDTLCQATISSIKSVESKLAEQIKYLTQVSTGHPHEGSSYPAQKDPPNRLASPGTRSHAKADLWLTSSRCQTTETPTLSTPTHSSASTASRIPCSNTPTATNPVIINGFTHFKLSLRRMCGEEGPIRAIFLAEFHHLLGPRIRCQASVDEQDTLTRDIFDSVSNYIIPKPDLAQQKITLNALNYKISGYPIILEDKKYKRNIFIFNVCFVCHSWSRTVQYEAAIMKLHNCLVNMELECEFVSREENTPLIHEIIKKILKNINEHGSCMLNVGAPGGPSQLLNLKVTPTSLSPETPVVHDYDVPILLVDWTKYPRDAWDLTTRELLKYIDGFNHIARIAELVGVKSHLVKCDVVNLIYYGFAKVIPILAYSDNYGITPKFPQLSQGSSSLESVVSRFSSFQERSFCERKNTTIPRLKWDPS
ncbi:NPRL2 [Lepeophtheirus salmonis]|uniref:Mediator of RNA polymerase II transcription subunit 11 n=1 Tax=Lepeophtheirus salmonis TaxID=72036 RepID=A0A7R8CUP8_LEPSM|nr:NPRL2 [Lepeophtheirus salmonis]CAF2902108.1 NPRL2 [Lepeophtheirus salmonis]